MMPPYSCTVPGRKPGHVLERDERDVERVAEPDEPRALHRRVDVERAGEHRRLVRDDADRPAVEPREADDDVLRVVLVDLEKVAVVDDRVDDVEHVVGLVRRGRHESCRAPSSSRSERIGRSARAADRRGCSTA